MDRADEIFEVVSFIKDRIVTLEERVGTVEERVGTIEERMVTKEALARTESSLKNDIRGLGNRLDDELDKRKVLDVRVGKIEEKIA